MYNVYKLLINKQKSTHSLAHLHVDHAGPFLGKQFLIVIDAYSKWLEAKLVSSVSSHSTIGLLRSIFATHGLPETIVSVQWYSFHKYRVSSPEGME